MKTQSRSAKWQLIGGIVRDIRAFMDEPDYGGSEYGNTFYRLPLDRLERIAKEAKEMAAFAVESRRLRDTQPEAVLNRWLVWGNPGDNPQLDEASRLCRAANNIWARIFRK